jgi:hypothetical protein
MIDLHLHWQNLEKSMSGLIDEVKDLLPQTDIENAREMIEHNEFGCGFEIICEQLFEYDIKISPDIYQKIVEIGQSMKMTEDKWIFLKKLIKND